MYPLHTEFPGLLFGLWVTKWILELSPEFPLDKPLTWCWCLPNLSSSPHPSWALDHTSSCLLDISLISLGSWNLTCPKLNSLFCTLRPAAVPVFFISLKDITIHSDVQIRHLSIILKFSFPIHISSIITFFRVYHSISQGLFQRISLYTPTQVWTSRGFHSDCLVWHIELSICPGKLISVVTDVPTDLSQIVTWEEKNQQKIKKSVPFPWRFYYKS